jgi:hypothetical protein
VHQQLDVTVVAIPYKNMVWDTAQHSPGCLCDARFYPVQIGDIETRGQRLNHMHGCALEYKTLGVCPRSSWSHQAQRFALCLDPLNEISGYIVLMQVVVDYAAMQAAISRPDGTRNQA